MSTEQSRAVQEVIQAMSWGLECRSNHVGQLPFWHVFTSSPMDIEVQVVIRSGDACEILEQAINEWGWAEVGSPVVQSQILFALLVEREYHVNLASMQMLDYGSLLSQ